MILQTNNNRYMEYVSLGGDCSISHNLNKLKIRKNAYPFDWCKMTINQLIDILENNFKEFTDLHIKYKSDKHLLDDKASYVLTNKYNIIFAHEVLHKKDISNFQEDLSRRIDRFNTLSKTNTKNLVYVRIEKTAYKKSYNEKLSKLLYVLDKINTNYKLILILHSTYIISPHLISFSKLIIKYYDNFSSDWTMTDFDWTYFFNV